MREPAGPSRSANDEAWASIAPAVDPASVENARQSLAGAIIDHASTLGTDDLAALEAAALASFWERPLSMPVLRRQSRRRVLTPPRSCDRLH